MLTPFQKLFDGYTLLSNFPLLMAITQFSLWNDEKSFIPLFLSPRFLHASQMWAGSAKHIVKRKNDVSTQQETVSESI